MLVALRDLTPAGYRKVRDPFCSYRLLLMLVEAKKRNKRNEPRTRLDSTSGKKKEKKPSRERNIKLDRTGSATRKTEFTAEDSATQQDWSFQDGRQSFKTFLIISL